jgi:hypothetical protein
MTRNRKLAAVVIGVLTVGSAAAAATAELSVSSTSLSRPGLSSSQQKNLERGINDPAVATEAEVLAAGLREQFMERGEPLLSPGSHLSIDVASFRATSGDTATVDAVVTGPATGRWRLLLIRQGGSWLLIGTRKLP